ncbi:MAG TPA: Rieske (2Fe-2S) protein [Planctomycetota bacterium]|nr:Rieske (2Fe-2S) protein [Planctomycetota bacterium]
MREDRRGFLGGLVAAVFGLPGAAALLGARGAGGRWVDAGPFAALPDGEPRRILYDVRAGWEARKKACFLVRRGDSVIALDATCTHAGCTVRAAAQADSSGESGGGPGAAFLCPCHGGAFSIDGEAAKAPATRPLARLETRVLDGQVQVRV